MPGRLSVMAVVRMMKNMTMFEKKGAFAGITVNGASIRRDDDSTKAIYGPHVTTSRLLRGEIAVPASAHSFLNAVREAKAPAVAGN
jgi:lipid-binding SYLF domain-containing protein